MKKLLFILLSCTLLSFHFIDKNNELIGTWELNHVELNNDTIFYRGKFEYTLHHNFELNKSWIKNKEDSLTVSKRAEENFQKSMSVTISFLTDSTFKMTKIRSGGRINPNEYDIGIYELKSDSLLMTNQSRRDYTMLFIIDQENKRIFQKDGIPDYMVYQEYLKTN